MRDSRRKDYWFPALMLALLGLGLAARLYGAWCLRYNLNPDAGVVALMAKHIAEGRDFPVFFYGQAYMGSFEPMVSAALCRLFGCSGFMVCLGTALLGLLTLPFIYCWARDLAAARAAGIAALAWCLVGPGGFFHYQVSPRGGYAATLFFGTVVLWLSGRLIVRERQGNPPALAWYALLGLIMGLGWWSNQLITASLVTSALLFALLLLPRLFFQRVLAIGAGFALGSLPFWWWNATHQWASFNFLGSFGQRSVADGLELFFLTRFPDLLELPGAPLGRILAGAIFIAAILITAGVLFNAGRQRRLGPSVFGLLLFFFILISALLFSTSHFAEMNTSRYLLPLIPAIAVMVGVMTARLQAWLPARWTWVAWIPLLFLIIFQYPALQWAGQRSRGEEMYQRQIEGAAPFLRERGVEAAYIPYAKYSWHFALREKFRFGQLPVDRYLPYSRHLELSDRIAVFDNEGGVTEFLDAYGGSARFEQPQGVPLHSTFAPPDVTVVERPAATAARMVDSQGRDAFGVTTDRNLDTWWESAAPAGVDEWIEISFHRPERICLVRLLCFPEYPPELQIEGREPGGAWHPLTPVMPASYYFWSGPRPYFGDWLYRFNAVFPPVTVEALRLNRIGIKYGIRELQWFAPAETPATAEPTAFPELVRLIRERGINRLYCDRWVANAIHRTCGQAVQVSLAPEIFGDTTPRLDAKLDLTPQTGILARREDAGVCRDVLSQRLVNARETILEPWVLFDIEAARKSEMQADDLGMQWAGFACFMTRNKSWAATLAGRADALYQAGNRDQAIDLVRRAARVYPNYHPVIDRLTCWLAMDGNKDEAAGWDCQSARLGRPEISAEICFQNGVTFRGLTLASRRVRPGDSLAIRYYWQYPTRPLANSPRVFVHFMGAQGLFQDDHPLNRPSDADQQPLPEIFMNERMVTVPGNLPAGRYALTLGLYLPEARGRRIRANTRLPGKQNAFTLPVSLELTPP